MIASMLMWEFLSLCMNRCVVQGRSIESVLCPEFPILHHSPFSRGVYINVHTLHAIKHHLTQGDAVVVGSFAFLYW